MVRVLRRVVFILWYGFGTDLVRMVRVLYASGTHFDLRVPGFSGTRGTRWYVLVRAEQFADVVHTRRRARCPCARGRRTMAGER